MAELESAQSWEQARKIAALIGHTPSTFFSCIRFLRNDFENHNNELSKAGRDTLYTLLRSASFKAPLYYCALTFRPQAISSLAYISPAALMTVFKPDELSVIIALLYLCRRVRKLCAAEEWQFISQLLCVHADLGGIVGRFIPTIGFANGIMAGAVRHVASALFDAIDKKEFPNYRRLMKRTGRYFDQQEEFKKWGCTHSQIASLLTQALGLGPVVGNAVGRGLSPVAASTDGSVKDALSIQMAVQWIDALHSTGKPPLVVNDARFYPLAESLEPMLTEAGRVKDNGSPHSWLLRGKSDISPETTPALFHPVKEAPVAAQEVPPPPEGVINEISKDIEELEAEDS